MKMADVLDSLAAVATMEMGEGSDPVSYTHLDVYKRQGQYAVRRKESIKAQLFIKVPEGGIELASIKVFEPTKPPEKDSNGYYLRQFESDITR